MHARSRFGRMLPALLLPLLWSGCARPDGSATEHTICRELRADLPSWSRRDTAQTLASGARLIAVFEAVCPAP